MAAIALAVLLVFSTSFGYALDIYVTKSGSPAPSGDQSAPYQMIQAGIARAGSMSGSNVLIQVGKYYETFTTDTPCILKADQGTVTIGKMDFAASTTLEIITLNTHLFGDEFFPGLLGETWQDYNRAEDIADFFIASSYRPDVVGFQEIWDEDLFLGGDGASGILLRSGYLDGDHGDVESDILNSGLAIMSKYSLMNFQQLEFDDEAGFFEPQAAKGWVQATIFKDEFSIGLFNTHTQADNSSSDIETRALQIAQLRDAVINYRVTHPDHAVFVMGDFNVYGEQSEYYNVLLPRMGTQAGGMDADRNSPGFVYGTNTLGALTLWEGNPLANYFDDETVSGRLDYIFYFPSLDGSVEILPTSVNVLPFIGRMLPEDGDDFTTNQSSDHWSVHAQFNIIRQ